ncbi:YkgJ family cysteine cluster protein [Denitrificimonas caeni]|uniref:YkgJ family cysteine cluster protein n=1 Tax=Denitrificimonas caeni TaxID=521720 RepID=UPI001964D134|nr:YkgJ family cysteine cluster protein [Denitrificimonas caeni]
MECRVGCGACCIAPSIHTPMPNMPQGKKAGERCFNLNAENLCDLFGRPERPAFCGVFQAEVSVCGSNQADAIRLLGWLENATAIAR